MAEHGPTARLSTTLTLLLPYLRRYARALTGSQTAGDRYAAATLDGLLIDRGIFDNASSDRVALFSAFHRNWSKMDKAGNNVTCLHQNAASSVTPLAREALLLKSIEGFAISEIAEVLQCPEMDVQQLLDIGRHEVGQGAKGRIMVIEDEFLIADDLEDKIVDLGHDLFGIARTHAEARAMVTTRRPDLILSDIQLADGSSGVEAVADILNHTGDVPVIFVTAFPERLLTGAGEEPAFVVPKPYGEDQMRSAIAQAMLFASQERQLA